MLTAEDKTMFVMFTTIGGAVLNIILNYYLIPLYSGVGAAWATVISYSVTSYFVGLFIPKVRKLFVSQTLGMMVLLRPVSMTRFLMATIKNRNGAT